MGVYKHAGSNPPRSGVLKEVFAEEAYIISTAGNYF